MAAELGVAPATVLRALSNHPNVTSALRRQIIELAQKRRYHLPERIKKSVAVIIPGFSFEGYTGLVLSALTRELHLNQFHAEIIPDDDIDILYDHIYAGVISIVWVAGLEKRWPLEHSTPLVALNAAPNQHEGIYQVTSDEREGITRGLELLYQAGRRRIAFVSTPLADNLNAMERVAVFHDFCAARNITAGSFHEESRPGNQLEVIARNIVARKADAVFAASEIYGNELLFRLTRHGLKIPADLSLLGLEHKSMASYSNPPLTTLAQDFDELARQSVQMLIHQIKRQPGPKRILVPYHFIERESV